MEEIILGYGKLRSALEEFGATKKESEVYIFITKRGPQKTSQISKQLKINKGLVHRILKNLQKKGLVEATLEYPIRYTAVSFEKVIDSYIESKREEARKIEEAKNSLLSDWRKISQEEIDSSIEKFGVIDGKKKIFNKISHLIRETNKQISMLVTVSDLSSIEQFGVLELLNNTSKKSNIKCRILTQISISSLKAINILKQRIEPEIDFRATSSSLGTPKFSRMIIRDDEEHLLFISDKKDQSSKKARETCLLTNSNAIIQAFNGVFQDLWNSSSSIEERIAELESGKPASIMEIIKDPVIAKKKYFDALDKAKEEILVVTSPRRLVEFSKNTDLIKKWCKNGVSTKIMAPITHENLRAVQALLTCSEVRHIPVGYRETTIIDGKKLFQFNTPCTTDINDCEILNLENVFFTTNQGYIQQTRKSLFEIWIKTHSSSENSIQPILQTQFVKGELHKTLRKMDRYGLKEIRYQKNDLTEKEVLDQIKEFNEKISKNKVNSVEYSDKLYFTGSRAFAVIHPPEDFQLPEFIIAVFRNEKTSAFGLENNLRIFLKPEGKEAPYQLVAIVVDNPKAIEYRRSLFEGMPGSRNIILVDRKKINVEVYGNTLFAGWTIPIPLIPTKYVLPPGCIMFEGYGKVDSGIFNFLNPSGRNQEVVFNHLKAFVTFFHPTSKYVGSGIDGFIDREAFQISYPPKK